MYQSPLGGEWGLIRKDIRRLCPQSYQSPLGGEWGLMFEGNGTVNNGLYQSPLGGEWGLMPFSRIQSIIDYRINPLWVGSGG